MLGSCFHTVIRSSEAGDRFAECHVSGHRTEPAFKGEGARIRNAF